MLFGNTLGGRTSQSLVTAEHLATFFTANFIDAVYCFGKISFRVLFWLSLFSNVLVIVHLVILLSLLFDALMHLCFVIFNLIQ